MLKNRFLWPFLLLAAQLVVDQLSGAPFSFFDPLLAAVVLYAYFHSYDVRDNILFAALCGLVKDMVGLDVFGLNVLSFALVSLGVVYGARFLNRQQDVFVFPVVFLAVVIQRFGIGLGRFVFSDAGAAGPVIALLDPSA
jgi:rod shape-determining protein MreD